MATCKKCIHFNDCLNEQSQTRYYGLDIACNDVQDRCKYYKPKSRFIELPCNIGDTVYVINGFKEIDEFEVEFIAFGKSYIDVGMVDDGEYSLSEIFLTREEAEQALKERKKNKSDDSEG